MFAYLCYFFMKCKSLYKFPTRLFFPSGFLMFFCPFWGGRFSYPFNHPSTSLLFFSFHFWNLFTCTEKHLISVCSAVMTTLLSAVNMVKFKPQTKPSWLGEEEKGPDMWWIKKTKLVLGYLFSFKHIISAPRTFRPRSAGLALLCASHVLPLHTRFERLFSSSFLSSFLSFLLGTLPTTWMAKIFFLSLSKKKIKPIHPSWD